MEISLSYNQFNKKIAYFSEPMISSISIAMDCPGEGISFPLSLTIHKQKKRKKITYLSSIHFDSVDFSFDGFGMHESKNKSVEEAVYSATNQKIFINSEDDIKDLVKSIFKQIYPQKIASLIVLDPTNLSKIEISALGEKPWN
ncbi:MAG: hypothetical protein ACTSYH_03350 [Candidatus Heimdallarchaeaceae archaeon]